jgi:hypothetical protein
VISVFVHSVFIYVPCTTKYIANIKHSYIQVRKAVININIHICIYIYIYILYILLQSRHQSVTINFVLSSWRLNMFTVTIFPFHKLIDIQVILLQVFLHIIQGPFIRVWRSEPDVNTSWKKGDSLTLKKTFSKLHLTVFKEWRAVNGLNRNLHRLAYKKKSIMDHSPSLGRTLFVTIFSLPLIATWVEWQATGLNLGRGGETVGAFVAKFASGAQLFCLPFVSSVHKFSVNEVT